MRYTTSDFLPSPRSTVWDWYTRPGAVERLTPPFLPMRVAQCATQLRDGTTVFDLPGGMQWRADHDARAFFPGKRFVDSCTNLPFSLTGWRHEHNFSDGGPGGSIVTDVVSTRVPLPRTMLDSVFRYRQEQLRQDLTRAQEFRALRPQNTHGLTIAMTGSSGLVGTALAAQLSTLGHTVVPLVRSQATHGQRLWNPHDPDPRLLDGIDAVIHLAGEPIGKPFTQAHIHKLYQSRVTPTARLAQLAAESAQCTAFISASAVGYYGAARGDEVLGEQSEAGTGVLADVVAQWETASATYAGPQLRVVHVRTGIALSGGGGMLPLLAALAQSGLSGPIGDGSHWFSWIALDDLTDIYIHALVDEQLEGPVNAVAPQPVTNAAFTQELADILHRPNFMRVPRWAPRLLLGKVGRDELAVASQRVVPTLLNTRGHSFRYATVNSALAHELGVQP